MKSSAIWPLIVVVAVLVFVLDLATKLWVIQSIGLGQSVEVIPGFLNLHHIKNTGAAFGLGNSWPEWVRLPFFVAVFVIALAVLYSFYRRCVPGEYWLRSSLGLVSGGALGNLVDRVFHGRVTDFIDVYLGEHHWYFFNVADMGISIGVALLFIHVWILEGRARDGEQAPSS